MALTNKNKLFLIVILVPLVKKNFDLSKMPVLFDSALSCLLRTLGSLKK